MEDKQYYIYKLKYPSKEYGLTDLLIKGILLTENTWEYPTHNIIDLGEGKFDIMTENTYDFGDNLIMPVTPDHSFAGWELNNEI